MGTPKHGRKGRIIADVGATPGSGVAIVPMLVNWATDGSVDQVDTTNCDDDNKTSVSGLPNFELTFDVNMDADSDSVYAMCDGEARLFYHYPDRAAVAGKLRYNYGFGRFSLSESGGATSKLGQSITCVAAGSITRVFV
jgi:hypothetical protein